MTPTRPKRKKRAPGKKKAWTNPGKQGGSKVRFDKAKFLDALRQTKQVGNACKAIGMSRSAAFRHKREDADFAEAWNECFETAIDQLEQSALDRAINGWEEPVWYLGEEVGTVRKFSTGLTIFMLKAWRRERYLFEQQVIEDADAVAEKLRQALANMDTSVPEAPEDIED